MIDSLLATVYIDFLLQDNNISFIEVWEDRLFLWKYKGSPRIATDLGLDFTHAIYYRPDDYIKLSKKYYPDLTTSKSPKVLSGLVQQHINDAREAMDDRYRGYAPSDYTEFYPELHSALASKNARTGAEYETLPSRLLNRARMVQDRFGARPESFADALYVAEATRCEGESLKDAMQEFFTEAKGRADEDRIRHWNISIITPENPKEGDLTRYGRTRRSNQIGLRRTHGDVFRVYVGGTYDTSSFKARSHNCTPTI